MSEREDRLARCFASVFPTLTPEEIRTASVESVAAWDSLAAVTLVALVEQEFDVKIDVLDLPDFSSFVAFWSYLDPHHRAGPGNEVDRSP